jgi:hypothetical protein
MTAATDVRTLWLEQLRRIAMPVLEGFASKTLLRVFVQQTPGPEYNRPPNAAHVEAFCRVFMGVAPLFAADASADGDDVRRATLAAWTAVVDDGYINWDCGDQLMVEAANLAYAFLLYPRSWQVLPAATRAGVFGILGRAAAIKPCNNNWLLFKCAIDTFLHKHGKVAGLDAVHRLMDTFETWYVGDGWYKDGPGFHMDYYNSFVILPFLYVIYNELRQRGGRPVHQTRFDAVVGRVRRHAEFLERLIATDGTFPLFGRSMVYRTAAFHALAFCATHVGLPSSLRPGQVRRALGQVHERMFALREDGAQFDAAGFLNLGFNGAQPEVANRYSNNGSCYFTCLSFMPLAAGPTHPFWSDADAPFTQEIAWTHVGSTDLKKDTARA